MVEPLIEIARPIYENIIILMLPLMGALRYLGSTYFFLSLILFLGISGGLALVGFLIKRPSIYLLRLQIKSGTTTVHATVHEPYVRHLAYEINTARERKIQARRAANWKLT